MSLREPNEFTRRTLLRGIGVSSVALVAGTAKAGAGSEGAARLSVAQSPEDRLVISSKRPTVIAVSRDNDPLTQIAAERLAAYIERVPGSKPLLATLGDLETIASSTSAIVLSEGSVRSEER